MNTWTIKSGRRTFGAKKPGILASQVLKYFENCETDFDENGKEYVMINVDCGENQLKNAITNEVRSVW